VSYPAAQLPWLFHATPNSPPTTLVACRGGRRALRGWVYLEFTSRDGNSLPAAVIVVVGFIALLTFFCSEKEEHRAGNSHRRSSTRRSRIEATNLTRGTQQSRLWDAKALSASLLGPSVVTVRWRRELSSGHLD
jgi:hypothetical protein